MENITEYAVMGKLVLSLIDEGFCLQVTSNNDGSLLILVSPNDLCKFHTPTHWVRVRPSNGVRAIVDYSTNLEEALKSSDNFNTAIEALEDL